MGLRPPDAADPRAVRAPARRRRGRSTSCSARSSCWSGRCSTPSAPATGRCCSIDEVDRADDEFEAFLLELLSDFQITIPEIGTIAAEQPPLVVLTSNRTRELHDALKRRCLYHWVGYPSAEREVEIVLVRAPGVSEALARKVVAAVNRLRDLDLAKPPGVAETHRLGAHARRARRGRPRRPRPSTTPSARSSRSATTSSWCASDLERDRLRCLTRRRVRRASLRRLRPSELRDAGLAVGSGDVLTYCAAVARSTRPTCVDLYWAGRTTLVTRRDQIPVYDRVFRRFFLDEADERPHRAGSARDAGATPGRSPCSRCRRPSRPASERDEERGPARPGGLRRRGRCGTSRSPPARPRSSPRCAGSCARIRLTPPRRRTRRTAPARAGRAPDLRRTVRETMRTARRAGRAVLAPPTAAACGR